MTRMYVAPVSFGLGDLVVSLPVIQALIARGDTWLVARAPVQAAVANRIDGLAGCIAEDDFDPTRTDGRYVDLRDHPLQRDHWWGSAAFENAFGPLSINEILARISTDFGIDADFARPVPFRADPRPELASSVVLVFDTDGPTKRWPVDRWAAVAAQVRERGLAVLAVTRYEASSALGAAGVEAVCAPTPDDAIDVLTAARAVVGVDTGLTHVSAQQLTPTVTVCRRRNVYFRSWPHTRAVRGDACDDACAAVEDEYAYNERVDLRGFEWKPRSCPVEARCLDTVKPDHVVHALDELL